MRGRRVSKLGVPSWVRGGWVGQETQHIRPGTAPGHQDPDPAAQVMQGAEGEGGAGSSRALIARASQGWSAGGGVPRSASAPGYAPVRMGVCVPGMLDQGESRGKAVHAKGFRLDSRPDVEHLHDPNRHMGDCLFLDMGTGTHPRSPPAMVEDQGKDCREGSPHSSHPAVQHVHLAPAVPALHIEYGRVATPPTGWPQPRPTFVPAHQLQACVPGTGKILPPTHVLQPLAGVGEEG